MKQLKNTNLSTDVVIVDKFFTQLAGSLEWASENKITLHLQSPKKIGEKILVFRRNPEGIKALVFGGQMFIEREEDDDIHGLLSKPLFPKYSFYTIYFSNKPLKAWQLLLGTIFFMWRLEKSAYRNNLGWWIESLKANGSKVYVFKVVKTFLVTAALLLLSLISLALTLAVASLALQTLNAL